MWGEQNVSSGEQIVSGDGVLSAWWGGACPNETLVCSQRDGTTLAIGGMSSAWREYPREGWYVISMVVRFGGTGLKLHGASDLSSGDVLSAW